METTFQKHWDTIKAVLRRKFTVVEAYLKNWNPKYSFIPKDLKEHLADAVQTERFMRSHYEQQMGKPKMDKFLETSPEPNVC